VELITFLGGAVATSVAWPLASRAQRGDKLPTSAGVAVMPRVEADLIAAEITPRGGKEREVARALQAMDFRVHAVGATISVDAPRERWKAVFAARFAGIAPVGTFTCTPLAGPEYKVEMEVTAYRGAGDVAAKQVSVVL